MRLQHFFSDMFGTYFQKYGGVLVCFLSMVPSLRATDKPTEIFLQTLHDLVNMGLGFRDGFVALKSLESIQVLAERISGKEIQIKIVNESSLLLISTLKRPKKLFGI